MPGSRTGRPVRTGLTLRAGTVEITPSRPGPMGGFIARGDRPSLGRRDPLEAAILVLEDGSSSAGWVTLDAIAVTETLADRVREVVRRRFGSPSLPVVVAASHTHSAPTGWMGSIHPGHAGLVEETMLAELLTRLDGLAGDMAGAPPVPVQARWSIGHAPGLGANRNDPGVWHDDTVGVLSLHEGRRLLALVVDAATHPTVLGADNMLTSADWVGAMRADIRATVGPDVVVAFLQGAAGDVSTRFTRRPGAAGEVERLGGLGAAAVRAALDAPAPVTGPLRHASSVIDLPRRPLPSLDLAQAALDRAHERRRLLAEADPGDPQARLAQVRLDGAMLQHRMVSAGLDPRVRLPISVIRLGEVVWAHLPVEPFTAVGTAVRGVSPFRHTRVVGYSDGYRGYLVDEAAEAVGTYEALSSLLRAEDGARVVQVLAALMERAGGG